MYANGIVVSRKKIEKLKITIEELKKKMHSYRMKTDEVKDRDKLLSKGRQPLISKEKS